MPYVAPTVEDVMAYAPDSSWPEADFASALEVETAAQLKAVRFPTQADPLVDEDYPAPLAEALKRRVVRNLAVRPLHLGVEASAVSDMGVSLIYVRANDVEVARLEGPYKRRPVG